MAKRVRIETDRNISRALLARGTDTERSLRARAAGTARAYRRFRLKHESPGYPFASNDRSVKDPGAITVNMNRSAGQIEITVNAPGAPYIEEGGGGGVGNRYMRIPMRDGFTPRARKRRTGRPRGRRSGPPATFIRKEDGRYYMFTVHVKPYPGRQLLYKAVRIAFGRRNVI